MRYTRKTLFITVAAILVAAGGFAVYAFRSPAPESNQNQSTNIQPETEDSGSNPDAKAPEDTPSPNPQPSASNEAVGTTVTKSGQFDCLKPSTTGPTTTECAYGLIIPEGTQYALQSDDPVQLGSIPTGQTIKVTGTITAPASAEGKYHTSGTIKIQTIERL